MKNKSHVGKVALACPERSSAASWDQDAGPRCRSVALQSSVMPATSTSTQKLRWHLIPVRVLFVTFLLTLLSFAISLLLGILGILIGARLRGVHPNMAMAYRQVAMPAAAAVGVIVLISAGAMEIRHYRQTKGLAEIERASR